MERGIVAPLSPNEEVTLRRVALGVAARNDLRANDLARLIRLRLVEEREGRLALTARDGNATTSCPRRWICPAAPIARRCSTFSSGISTVAAPSACGRPCRPGRTPQRSWPGRGPAAATAEAVAILRGAPRSGGCNGRRPWARESRKATAASSALRQANEARPEALRRQNEDRSQSGNPHRVQLVAEAAREERREGGHALSSAGRATARSLAEITSCGHDANAQRLASRRCAG